MNENRNSVKKPENFTNMRKLNNTFKQPMRQRRNLKGKLKNILIEKKVKTQHTKTYRLQ